jgi:cytochrome c oxidase assembly protein subunit 15
MHVMFLLACTQVVLGISTLVLHVPIALAAAHLATALLVFTSLLVVCHGLRGRAELTI